MYVSRKLDALDVPNEPPWRVPAFTYDVSTVATPTPFYRLSAQVVVWLEACGSALEVQVLAGKAAREQLDEYLRLMEPIWLFSSQWIDREKVRAARMEPPSLPPAPDGPK